jgi:hypothetical protein
MKLDWTEVPAPGIHPRIIFNPEDVPLIKERLQKTKAGQAVDAAIRSNNLTMLTGPGAKFGKEYDALALGDVKMIDIYTLPYNELKTKYPSEIFPTPDPKTNPKGEKPMEMDPNIPYTTMYEAFRCLLDDDQVGGKKVAGVITSLAKIADVQLSKNIADAKAKYEKANSNPKKTVEPVDDSSNFQEVGQGPTREGSLGLDYDFAFNFMTQEQRDTVRSFISHATKGMGGIGCETLRTLHTGTSNHISWCSGRGLFVICAIEGEPGYDPTTWDRFSNAQLNFINALYPTGEAFEGWGKDFIFMEHMVIMAKRGKNILGSCNVRAAFNNYFIASMNPWGNGFTFCDSLAGSGGKVARNADVLMYHTLFPKDVAGDFVYRNQIEENYDFVGSKNLNTHHPFAVMDSLCCAIFSSDLMPTAWDDESKQVTKDRPLTYFSEDTGNMITRSAWGKNDLYMSYLNRSVPGGHVYSDRSHFSMYGLGRFWSIYHFMRQIHEQYLPANRSVLMADGNGPSIMEARSAEFIDHPLVTFSCTDLSKTWNYKNTYVEKPGVGAQKIQNPFSYNDFRLHASPLSWMNYSIGQLPNWQTSLKPDPSEKADWYKVYDVKKAFRTAGLIRGNHPYALIVDDLQLDDKPHAYDWGMILADDLTLGSVKTTSTEPGKASADIILDENLKASKGETNAPANDRHLLVRVLSATALTEPASKVELMAVPNPPQRDMQINKLHITANCVSPEFKVLLFPFKKDMALPTATWNADHTAVTIAWPDQSDVITFSPDKNGRTLVKIKRDSAELLGLK